MAASHSRYIPALDGLRALAVLAVIAYHLRLPWAIGGLLGVTVFFVLSGYLITSLLIAEWDSTRRIDLKQFWLRRVRRLVPAIVFLLVAVAALCTLLDHTLLTKMRPDILPSLLFYNNWWQIFRDVSYFEALGAPSPLAHFWSLAIEEQFYLVWPVVLFLALRKGAKTKTLGAATLVLAALSALEMALLFNPSADPSRVYYGTDTRAFSLLIGAALAFAWPAGQIGAKNALRLGRPVRRVLDGIGLVALVALLAMMAFANGFSPFLYRGGILLASLLTAVVIAVMVHPDSLLGRVAGTAPLVWVGKRSYGIYLWHYPLFLLMNPRTSTAEMPWWLYLVEVAVVFAVAAFSYRFVENPIRKGKLGAFAKRLRAGKATLPGWLRTHAVPAIGAAAVALVAVGGVAFVPPTNALEGADLLKQAEERQNAEGNADGSAASGQAHAAEEGMAAGDAAAPTVPNTDVLMIGDSVSVRAIPYFEEAFPHGTIDAAVSRQLYVGREVLESYLAQGEIGPVVVFGLGTNGPATDEQLDDLLEPVASKQVWLINTRSPQDWVQISNDALASAAERYPNVHLIDWFSASADHDEYFDGDGTHLTEEGAAVYIGLVRDAISDYLPAHPEDATEEEQALASAQEALKVLLEKAPDALASRLSPIEKA